MTTSPAVGGNYTVTLQANDPAGAGTIRSGVVHMELLVDGQLVQQWNQPCPNGACSMTQSRLMNSSQSLANHTITAFADDRAMNSGFATRGATVGNPVQKFGFNDVFFEAPYWSKGNAVQPDPPESDVTRLMRGLTTATEAGAELIRFQINGCDLAEAHEGDPPSQWEWGRYRPLFEQIRTLNSASGPDLGVIVHLTDSPVWANEKPGTPQNPGVGLCSTVTVTPPNKSPKGEDFYRQFTAGFLREFAREPLNGIAAVQAWNEPNSPLYWGRDESGEQFKANHHEDPDHFARLVNIARIEAKDFNENGTTLDGSPAPDVTFLPGALSPAGTATRPYIVDVLTQSNEPGDTFVDPDNLSAWAAHYYSRDETVACCRDADGDIIGAQTRVAYQDRKVRGGLSKAGASNLGLWVTELGFSAAPSGTNPPTSEQASRLVWAYNKFQRTKYKAIVVHRVLDPRDPLDAERIDELAVIERALPSNQWSPRQGYCALAAQQGRSGGSAPSLCVNPGPLP